MRVNIEHKEAGKFEETRFEKIHNVIFENSGEASIIVAEEIANLIREKEKMLIKKIWHFYFNKYLISPFMSKKIKGAQGSPFDLKHGMKPPSGYSTTGTVASHYVFFGLPDIH